MNDMKTNSTQQEILLFTNTKFCSRPWCDQYEPGLTQKLSDKEKLEEACWRGLITDMMPEICERTYDASITLWEINKADSFLDLQYGEFPKQIEKELSVNPYVFMGIQNFS